MNLKKTKNRINQHQQSVSIISKIKILKNVLRMVCKIKASTKDKKNSA